MFGVYGDYACLLVCPDGRVLLEYILIFLKLFFFFEFQFC